MSAFGAWSLVLITAGFAVAFAADALRLVLLHRLAFYYLFGAIGVGFMACLRDRDAHRRRSDDL
jgi:hypothetical protein